MQETRRNLLVGIFVLFGLVALGSLILMYGRAPTWMVRGQEYPLNIIFDSAAGIRPQNLVTVRGIEIGRVRDVSLVEPGNLGDQAKVNVRVAIYSQYKIPQGSTAITTEPVLGQGRPPIEILPGPASNPPLDPGMDLRGTVRGAVESIFPKDIVMTFQKSATQIGEAAGALTPVLADVHEILKRRNPREVDMPGGPPGNLFSASVRLDGALRHFNDVLGDPEVKSNLRGALDNFHQISEEGKAAVADFKRASARLNEGLEDVQRLVKQGQTSIEHIEARVDQISDQLVGNMQKLNRVLDHANIAMATIAGGEGTIGRLVRDEELYESLVLTVDRLAATIDEIKILVKEWQKGEIRVSVW